MAECHYCSQICDGLAQCRCIEEDVIDDNIWTTDVTSLEEPTHSEEENNTVEVENHQYDPAIYGGDPVSVASPFVLGTIYHNNNGILVDGG